MESMHIPDSSEYLRRALEALDELAVTQRDALRDASDLVVECVERDGVVQSFGTGHSAGLAMEVAGRAGGLVATNLLSLQDPILYGGAPVSSLHWLSEREPSKASEILACADVRADDIFVIISNSGANGSIVEMAQLARSRGNGVIAITSMKHTSLVSSAHPSGAKLHEVADVVIDNLAPFGDAMLSLPGGEAFGPLSSLTTILAIQIFMTDAIAALARREGDLPIFISANVPGGDQHNEQLVAHYGRRIRRMDFPAELAR